MGFVISSRRAGARTQKTPALFIKDGSRTHVLPPFFTADSRRSASASTHRNTAYTPRTITCAAFRCSLLGTLRWVHSSERYSQRTSIRLSSPGYFLSGCTLCYSFSSLPFYNRFYYTHLNFICQRYFRALVTQFLHPRLSFLHPLPTWPDNHSAHSAHGRHALSPR